MAEITAVRFSGSATRAGHARGIFSSVDLPRKIFRYVRHYALASCRPRFRTSAAFDAWRGDWASVRRTTRRAIYQRAPKFIERILYGLRFNNHVGYGGITNI